MSEKILAALHANLERDLDKIGPAPLWNVYADVFVPPDLGSTEFLYLQLRKAHLAGFVAGVVTLRELLRRGDLERLARNVERLFAEATQEFPRVEGAIAMALDQTKGKA